MSNHFLIAATLLAASASLPLGFVPDDRTTQNQGDCIGKKRVLTGPVRLKRAEPRRPCHVVVPILM